MAPFGHTLLTRYLPSGQQLRTPGLPIEYLTNAFQNESLPDDLPTFGENRHEVNPRRPVDRIAQAFGSYANPAPFLLTERQINAAKGRIFSLRAPQAVSNTRTNARLAIAQPTDQNINRLFSAVRAVGHSPNPYRFWQFD